MIVSRKIGRMFKCPGFVNVDYLVAQKIPLNVARILNILTEDWRKWVRPVGFGVVDPTFGKTDIGGTATWGSNAVRCYRHSCPEAGIVSIISIYLTHLAAGHYTRVGMYDDSLGSPNNLSVESASIEVTVDGWQNITVANTNVVAADYHLAFQMTPDDGVIWYQDASPIPDMHHFQIQAYGPFPNPYAWFNGGSGYTVSIYATYTTVFGGGLNLIKMAKAILGV